LLSCACALLYSLAAFFVPPVVCFQQLAHSLTKIPGVGYPGPTFGLSVGVNEGSRCRRRICGTPGWHTRSPSSPVTPKSPLLRKKRKNRSLQVLCLPLLQTPCRVSPFPATLTQTPGMGVCSDAVPLTNPILSALCFHGVTNCFSRNSFIFTIICVAPGCGGAAQIFFALWLCSVAGPDPNRGGSQ
jgi:hypothetical protein